MTDDDAFGSQSDFVLTLVTSIFPARYPALLPLADGSSLTSQHLEKYDVDIAQGVLWVLGEPLGLTEQVTC